MKLILLSEDFAKDTVNPVYTFLYDNGSRPDVIIFGGFSHNNTKNDLSYGLRVDNISNQDLLELMGTLKAWQDGGVNQDDFFEESQKPNTSSSVRSIFYNKQNPNANSYRTYDNDKVHAVREMSLEKYVEVRFQKRIEDITPHDVGPVEEPELVDEISDEISDQEKPEVEFEPEEPTDIIPEPEEEEEKEEETSGRTMR